MLLPTTFLVQRLPLQNIPTHTPLSTICPSNRIPGAESLLFLLASTRANLSHMGDCVDREVAMSQQDKEVETEAAWQSHYFFWCLIIGILDPCGNKIGYQCIVAIYAKFVMWGINFYNKDVLRSLTLRGYATAVNTLFQLRGFKQPTDLSNPSNMPGIIINNLIKEETVASQRSPLDSTIFAELQQAASSSHSCNS
jgi:hypothetical protein